MDAEEVLLGYLETASRVNQLHRIYFPSKVGGKPAWLAPPSADPNLAICPACNGCMTFLLQVYACQESVSTFHRTLYVFVCLPCGGEFAAYRSQLPRINSFYSSEPSEVEDTLTKYEDEFLENCCAACGIPVGKEEQCEESCVPNALHIRCKNASLYRTVPTTFDEYELVVAEEESVEDLQDDFTHEKKLHEEYKRREATCPDELLDRSEEEAFGDLSTYKEDAVFARFLERVNQNPGHVIRYAAGGKPLWYSQKGFDLFATNKTVPNCEACGSPRVFELQLQPNLLQHIKADSVDFGVLCIFTCQDSCEPKLGYSREIIIVDKF